MSHPLAARWRTSGWLLAGEWRLHPMRALVAIAAIAIGVALGFAIHLINAAAFNEFSAAVKSLSGQSDLQVRAAEPTFDEALYPLLAQRAGVALASPVLEVEALRARPEDAADHSRHRRLSRRAGDARPARRGRRRRAFRHAGGRCDFPVAGGDGLAQRRSRAHR